MFAKHSLFVSTIAAVLLVGCSSDLLVQPDPQSPVLAIADGAHGGNAQFHFLPPIVKQPIYDGVFDGSLAPVVRITENGTLLVELTPIVSSIDEHYHANWATAGFDLDLANDYRLTVLLDGHELGFADLAVGLTGKGLKNVNTGEYVPLKDGRTLPIKFRLEEGVLPPVLSTILFISDRDGNLELYKMFSDGSDQTRLTWNSVIDQQPALSPDGAKIAYRSLSGDFDGEIYVMNIDGSDRTQVTSDGCWDYNPAWSPDMTKLAYTCGVGAGNNDVFIINVDGTGNVALTTGAQGNHNPSWSPDGSRIVFESSRDGNAEIYTMDTDGSNLVRLTDHSAGDYSPSWSPIGDRIAFASRRDGDVELFVMNTDGSGVTQLTSNDVGESEPIWSPDGTMITFTSNRFGDWEVFVMNADGTNVVQLTENEAYEEGLSWGSN